MYTLYYLFYNILDRAVTSRDVKQSVDLAFKMVWTIMAIDYYGKMIVEIFLIVDIKLNITQYRMQLKSKWCTCIVIIWMQEVNPLNRVLYSNHINNYKKIYKSMIAALTFTNVHASKKKKIPHRDDCYLKW